MNRLKKVLPILVIFAGLVAGAGTVLWCLWNRFLVPATGVSPIGYGLAVAGWTTLAATVLTFWWTKAFADFAILSISLAITRKKVKQTVDEQEELLKHFAMFGKKENGQS